MKKTGKFEKAPEAAPAKPPKVKNLLLQTYFTSLACMILCVSMFFGTSYAWFSSEVTNTTNEIYAGTLYEAAMGLKELMYYFVVNNSDLTTDDVDKLIQPPKGPGSGEDDDDEASRYLSDDGRIVSVTYGTKNADGSYSAYKTFILNYNNFSVNVKYGDVTYTIPAYGYVVVMH